MYAVMSGSSGTATSLHVFSTRLQRFSALRRLCGACPKPRSALPRTLRKTACESHKSTFQITLILNGYRTSQRRAVRSHRRHCRARVAPALPSFCKCGPSRITEVHLSSIKQALFHTPKSPFEPNCIGNGHSCPSNTRSLLGPRVQNSLTKDSALAYKPTQRDKRLEAISFFAGWND
jgi:hypothetical protein